MTGALTIYSATFMRYALAVSPKNYLLFACHFVNEGAQLTQGYRWMQYNQWGGRELEMKKMAESGVEGVKGKVEQVVEQAKQGTRDVNYAHDEHKTYYDTFILEVGQVVGLVGALTPEVTEGLSNTSKLSIASSS
ncbi:putative UPF0041 protein FMP37 [Glarea lozoyensis 74030]|uniref:Mitochondrial pyruvate carrier n=1 Tax=Glarea lozoyensis (strain ATCC 74030 / MF5533) TaxID=1104152 RepID=H0EDW0_GLAL7|nr:putative UPF0041 protein FMP37 [Glarea lozoyensis 74030]